MNKTPKIDFAVGGQAVIEGVMMRSPNFMTVCVRKENGKTAELVKPFKSLSAKIKILKLPFIRGILNMIEMLIYGMHALNFSANEYANEEIVLEKNKTTATKATEGIYFAIMIVLSFAFAILLFKFIPLWATTWLSKNIPFVNSHYIVFNLIDGVLKISIFIGYLLILNLSKNLRRVFEYHGAEHKAIFTYEKTLELTPDNAKIQSRFHPRCGTSFILIVFVISILFYTVLPKHSDFLINFTRRILVLPFIAGISYEILKLSAKNLNNFFVRILVKPGLLLQHLTTREPDKAQLEISLRALEKALELEKS